MRGFFPELIIEVTSACNRACVGCYAPNVVTNKPASELYEERPELFLDIIKLNDAINSLHEIPSITCIRGGEPSIHPKLSNLLNIAHRRSVDVMLETHARWLLPENVGEYSSLVEKIKSLGTIVKISFDKMHGLSVEQLKSITDFLEINHIDYRIAITESSLSEYLVTQSLCSWVSTEKIIFQLKSTTSQGLIRPQIGVINVKGELERNLKSKFFEESIEIFEVAQ